MNEKKNIKAKISIYVGNSSGFFLAIIMMILNLIATLSILDQMEYTYKLFIIVMYTILLTLLLFLIASKIKVYEIKYCYLLIALSVFQFARIIWMPNITNKTMPIILYIASGVFGILATINGYIKSKRRMMLIQEEEKENA